MIEHTAFAGPPQDGIYSQTLTLGNFFIVVSLVGDANLELGHNLLTKIEETINQTPQISASELVKLQVEGFGAGPKLNLLVARIENDHISLAGCGDVSAKLTRRGQIINLFSGVGVAGKLSPQDFLILATTQYFSDPSPEDPLVAALEIKFNQPLPAPSLDLPIPQPIHVQHPSRKILYVSLIFLITLISLIVFQLRSRSLENQAQAIQSINGQIQENLSSARKLSGLNNQIARDLLIQTRQKVVSQATEVFGKNYPPKLQKILSDLDMEIAATSRTYKLSSLDLFYDFSLLKADARVASVSLHKDLAVVLDSANGAIYSLNLSTKNAAIITGSDSLKKGQFLDFSPDDNFVWSPEQIIFKKSIKSSDKWGDIKDLKTFAGNIYLLDSKNSQIWKYQNTELGFLDIAPYLRAQSVDFSHAVNLAIDGSVYVLTTTGNIAKFTSGLAESFTITGVDPVLSGAVNFFVTDETENMYVLDNNGSRAVILTKKGAYISQYLLPEKFNFIMVNESAKKFFLFSGSKVYSLDLK